MLNQQDTVVLMNDDSLEDHGFSRLPPEIWLKIIQMLTKTTTRNITTTCRLFREITQPLLLRRLIFQLFVSVFNVFYPSHCQQLYGERPHMVLDQNFAERYNKRVEFVISSPWISPPRFAAWGSFQLMTEVTAETWKIVMLFFS